MFYILKKCFLNLVEVDHLCSICNLKDKTHMETTVILYQTLNFPLLTYSTGCHFWLDQRKRNLFNHKSFTFHLLSFAHIILDLVAS